MSPRPAEIWRSAHECAPSGRVIHGGWPCALLASEAPQLRITASGFLDASGRPLDGNGDGQPGGDYLALLAKARGQYMHCGRGSTLASPTKRASDAASG